MWMKERANKGVLDDNPAHEMSRGALGSAGPNISEQFFTHQHQQQQPADVEPRDDAASIQPIWLNPISSSCHCTDDEMM